MKFISLNEVLELTGRSRTKTYDDIAKGKFPAQVKSGSSSYWVLEEVLAWMQERMDERKQPI
jgi:predicted DNA-binding transcriptional regulator AlpA